MAISRFMDQVGDWNPQLLRELKGRLTRKNLLITLAISFSCQWLFYPFFKVTVFPGILPTLLIVLGSYLLSNDLSKEYRRKTIEFIRLTPQSSQEILIGKLLGVPILVYIAILSAIPLHLITALKITQSWMFLSYYLVWVIKGWLFYSLGLIYTLTLLKQRRHNYPAATIAGSVAFLTFILDRFHPHYLYSTASKWYGLSLNQSPLLHSLWMITLLVIVGSFFWKVLNRQFRDFQATLINKKQSYQITLFVNLLLLGFMIHAPNTMRSQFTFIWLFAVLPILSLGLIIVLFPHRQALLDWARYGHLEQSKKFWQDLIWGEKSPPIIAIFVNALITTIIWIVLLFINSSALFNSPHQMSTLQILLSPLITISMILIYAMVAQILMLNSSSNSKLLAIAVTSILVIFPPVSAIASRSSVLWLFSPFPMVGLYKGSTVAYFISLGLQLALLGLLTAKLKQQIYLVGASETQALLKNH